MGNRVAQLSFTAGELSPALYARTDLAKYASGLKRAQNTFIHPHGGMSNRAGFTYIAELRGGRSNPGILIPFQFSSDITFVIEATDRVFRFFYLGVPVRNGDGSIYEVASPYGWEDVLNLTWVQDADLLLLFHPNHPPAQLARFGTTDWRYSQVAFSPEIAPPPQVTASSPVHDTNQEGQQYRAKAYTYAVSAISAATGEESLPRVSNATINDLNLQGNRNVVTWFSVEGAEAYVIYKNVAGQFGYIGRTEGFSFTDENIVEDRSDGPQKGRNPFDGPGKYPRCGTFFEQRLVVGGSYDEPQAVYMSQSGNYRNFGSSSPGKASDAVTFRMRSRQVNEIRSLVAAKSLLVLTSGAEWSVNGGGDAGVITPSSIVLRPQSYRGAALVQPLLVGDTLLFPQATGGVVRDLSYSFTDDGYAGTDLTLLSRHLFRERRIVAWAYAQSPDSIIWCVMSDGSLLTLTYLREHEVWGWTRQVTDGYVEDVITVTEDEQDVPYFIIGRLVQGEYRRYVERLHTREFEFVDEAFFVDCGLTYEGSPATTISGLDHLEGRNVVALSDGNVVRDLRVTGGSITLPQPASIVHVGLPYVSLMETLDVDLGMVEGLGSMVGRMKGFSEATIRVEDSRGLFVGPSEDDLIEFKQRAGEAWSDPIALFTGQVNVRVEWDMTIGGNVVIRQDDPLPFTVQSIAPDWSIGG